MRKHYVYRHRTETDNRVYYIGCGSKNRAYDTRTGEWFGRSKEWHEIYEKEGLIVEILLETEDKDLALELEELLIQEYGRIEDGGSLVNKALFKGTGGIKHSEETKIKMSRPAPNRKPVLQYSKDGVLIKEYDSVTSVSKELNLNISNICSCCNGKRKSTGGFIWTYKT